ncbi:hypothetical protein Tco_0710344 [Tanacetum coccineum]
MVVAKSAKPWAIISPRKSNHPNKSREQFGLSILLSKQVLDELRIVRIHYAFGQDKIWPDFLCIDWKYLVLRCPRTAPTAKSLASHMISKGKSQSGEQLEMEPGLTSSASARSHRDDATDRHSFREDKSEFLFTVVDAGTETAKTAKHFISYLETSMETLLRVVIAFTSPFGLSNVGAGKSKPSSEVEASGVDYLGGCLMDLHRWKTGDGRIWFANLSEVSVTWQFPWLERELEVWFFLSRINALPYLSAQQHRDETVGVESRTHFGNTGLVRDWTNFVTCSPMIFSILEAFLSRKLPPAAGVQ